MKKTLTCLLAGAFSLCISTGFAQNVAINEDGSAPNPNALLDVKSFTRGMLIPRVSTTGRLAIPHTKGLLVYDTTNNLFWYNTGAAWQSLAQGAAGWLLTGNAGTDSSNFLGTTDNRPLVVKVNNRLSGWIDSTKRNSFWGYNSGSLPLQDSLGSIRNFDNTAVGYGALHDSPYGSYNTALGSQALAVLASGLENTATGYQSLSKTNTGWGNTANGSQSLRLNTTGALNTIIGYQSGTANVTGSSNTTLGAFTNLGASNLTNATAIGSGATVNASNKVRIGNSAVTVIEGQVPFTTPSDGRFKYQVKEDVKGLDFIMHLRPVTYRFDVKRFDEQQGNSSPVIQASYTEAAAIRRSGFIAQEVEKAADASGYNFSGIIKPKTAREHYSLSYESFVVPLVKGMQEQQKIIDAQNKKIEQQNKQVNELRQELDEIKQLLKRSK